MQFWRKNIQEVIYIHYSFVSLIEFKINIKWNAINVLSIHNIDLCVLCVAHLLPKHNIIRNT